MIRTQLRVYYGLRGLIGNALKHAIKRDMRSLARQGGEDSRHGIAGAVLYGYTIEGDEYWRDRNDSHPTNFL